VQQFSRQRTDEWTDEQPDGAQEDAGECPKHRTDDRQAAGSDPLAPSAAAQKSIAIDNIVSTPSNPSVATPMRVNPSAQAASNMAAKMSGTPGNAGSTMPASPTSASRAAIA
jgi:hypothetical protein